MTWNNRVVRQVFYEGTEDEEVSFSIHEAYYDDDGNVTAITVNPVAPIYYETDDYIKSLREAFEIQMKAFDLPVLKFEDY